MKLSRRMFASAAAALPLGLSSRAPAAGMSLGSQGLNVPSQAAFGNIAPVGHIQNPVVPSWQAHRLAMLDPDMRAAIQQMVAERHRSIHFIDADIAVMRSWSQMAKIAFQRQRNIATELAAMTTESTDWFGKVHQFVVRIMYGHS